MTTKGYKNKRVEAIQRAKVAYAQHINLGYINQHGGTWIIFNVPNTQEWQDDNGEKVRFVWGEIQDDRI